MDSEFGDLDRYVAIREKDIDLVLCIAAASIEPVWRLFVETTVSPVSKHSVSDASGEIDVVLSWPDRTVHIENKISAAFQCEQAARYRARAELADDASTVLLAPQKYLDAHPLDLEQFDASVSYEELLERLRLEPGPISREMSLLVEHAIEQHRRGRTGVVSEDRTAFFNDFAEKASDVGLPFENSRTRGPRSGFFYIHGHDAVAGYEADFVAKFVQGSVDIQLPKAGHLCDRLFETWAAEDLVVRSTDSDTLIVSRVASHLDPDRPLDEQDEALAIVLKAAVYLDNWWKSVGRSQLQAAANETGQQQ